MATFVTAGKVVASLLIPAPTPNTAPTIASTPAPSFTYGSASNYDLDQHLADADGDALYAVMNTGAVALPSGVTLQSAANDNLLIYDGVGAVVSSAGHTLTADDQKDQSSASSTFSIDVTATTGIRWHPGHYLKVQGRPAATDQDDYWDNDVQPQINQCDDIAEIIGVYVNVGWGHINTTGSTFVWTKLDAAIASLASKGNRRIIVALNYKDFTGSTVGSAIGPADLIGDVRATVSGFIMPVWLDAVRDRYIAAMQAIATRYDSDANFEMILTQESAPSFGGAAPQPGDYSNALMLAQLKVIYAAMDAAFINTNHAGLINSLGGGGTSALLEECYQLGMACAGPDARSNVSGYPMYEGLSGGVRDYRGLIPRLDIVSNSVFTQGFGPPSAIIDAAQAHGNSYLAWITSQSGANSYANIKTAIQADPLLVTSCPSQYPSCDTS